MGKIIEVYPRAGKTQNTAPVWQYDYGQILHINGIDLPASYKAEFSNTTRGDAIATVQTTDEITIPAQYLESGAAVYIWLVVVDEQSRTTEYALIVPVAARAKPTDLEPSPQEQSEIDQTLAALNSGVSQVEQIADAIPGTINDALEAAKESGEFDGEDGSSPEVTVAPIQGGHRITITDANGTHTVDILDGAKGDTGRGIVSVQKTGTAGLVDTYTITYTDSTTSTFTVTNGQNGTPGADGTTFTPTVSSEGVISWTNNGGKTNPQPVNIKGPQGDDGTSPTVSVADISGGHRVTVTDANGTRSFDVMDGDDYTLTAADKAEIAQQAAEEVDVPVTDVQVNGVSVLTDGVANVPVGDALKYGVMMVGLGIYKGNNGKINVGSATQANVKGGKDVGNPLKSDVANAVAFYGLAKAAGADMASSSNPLGTYTDAAKIAIQKMLGIYEAPWELIREDTVTNATEADIVIAVDGNGNPFELTDVIIQLIMDDANTPSAAGGNGDIRFVYGAGSNDYKRFFVGAMNHSAGATAIATMARITTTGGLLYGDFATVGSVSASSNLKTQQYYQLAGNRQMIELVDPPIYFNQIIVKAITGPVRYVLYGKRKWQ